MGCDAMRRDETRDETRRDAMRRDETRRDETRRDETRRCRYYLEARRAVLVCVGVVSEEEVVEALVFELRLEPREQRAQSVVADVERHALLAQPEVHLLDLGCYRHLCGAEYCVLLCVAGELGLGVGSRCGCVWSLCFGSARSALKVVFRLSTESF
jgi:hypothetical protein